MEMDLYPSDKFWWMTNWLCILDRANFSVVKIEGIWGVSSYHKNKLMKAKPDDICAFYLIGEGSKGKPAIAGIFKVTSNPFLEFSEIFQSKRSHSKQSEKELYPYRIRLIPIKIFEPELSFKELIPNLNFIKNKIRYSGHLIGKTMREIPAEDMDFIMSFQKA